MNSIAERMQSILQYAEAHPDAELDLDTLCSRFGLSKYHFHRLCSAYFGVPIMALVRMLRLKRAAHQLAFRPDQSVLEIALSNGYDSHEAFSRAFKTTFLKTPTEFRAVPDWDHWEASYAAIKTMRYSSMDANHHAEVQIVHFPELQVAQMEHRGAPRRLPETLQAFIAWRRQSGLPPAKSRTFNLLYDDPRTTETEAYRFGLACEAPHPLDGADPRVSEAIIPAGRCALIRHTGNDDALGESVAYLYASWLTASGEALRDFPIFLERISFYPEVAEHEAVTDIYLPIE